MEALSEIKASLSTELEALEQNRLKAQGNIRVALFIAIGILGIAVAVGLFVQSIELPGIAFIIAALIYGSVYYLKFQKYKGEFKQKVLPVIIKSINPGLKYNPHDCISKSAFKASKIFQRRVDRYKGEDYFIGMVDKTHVEFSELHAEERHKSTDSKGRTKTTYVTIFKGLFMIADFHKHFHGHTIVLPDTAEKAFGGWLGKKLQSWNVSRDDLVNMEDPEFEKEFVVYSDDQVEARYILSTSMMRRILELKHKFKCGIYLSFLDSKVYIAIYSNKNMLEPKLSQSLLNQGALKRFYDEINICLDIVEQLNLNTRIWSKQ